MPGNAEHGIGSPLEAMLVAREGAVAGNEALLGAVDRARDAGHSWREIGEVLGTTWQAAFRRFGHGRIGAESTLSPDRRAGGGLPSGRSRGG